jgi:hypothetical protein
VEQARRSVARPWELNLTMLVSNLKHGLGPYQRPRTFRDTKKYCARLDCRSNDGIRVYAECEMGARDFFYNRPQSMADQRNGPGAWITEAANLAERGLSSGGLGSNPEARTRRH